MSVYALKPKFQSLLRPLVRRLAATGVTPNQVTLFACGMSIVAGLLIFFLGAMSATVFLLLPVVLFVRMALNAIDGMLAREFAMRTPLGAILNEVTDIVSDAALYLPLVVIPGICQTEVVLVVLLAALTEFVGVQAVTISNIRRYDGPMGKSDRAVFFGLLMFLYSLSIVPSQFLNYMLAIALLLLGWTIFNRANSALAARNL